MCGLAGFISVRGKRQTWLQFESLVQAASVRGHDATGIVAVSNTFQVQWEKKPLRASEFLHDPAYTQKFVPSASQWVAAIAHTRSATVGTPADNRNNHPLEAGRLLGMHNGIISNDDEFRELFVEPLPAVDSFPPLAYLDAFAEGEALTPGMVRDVFSEVRGWFTYQFLDQTDPTAFWLVRGDAPLAFAWDSGSGVLWWASTPAILRASRVPFTHLWDWDTPYEIVRLPIQGVSKSLGAFYQVRAWSFTPANESALWDDYDVEAHWEDLTRQPNTEELEAILFPEQPLALPSAAEQADRGREQEIDTVLTDDADASPGGKTVQEKLHGVGAFFSRVRPMKKDRRGQRVYLGY